MKSITKTLKKETYISPDIEVVEIEIEQNILETGSGEIGQQGVSDFGGEVW